MMDESMDDALAVLEGLEDPAAKAIGFIEASNRLGDTRPGQGASRCWTGRS